MERQLVPHTIQKTYRSLNYIPRGIKMVHAPESWKIAEQGEGVVAAVIDTGIDRHHPDLKRRIVGCTDFTGCGHYYDDNGHGTHVTGTILASLDGKGIVGMAPKAKVLALKALDKNGTGQIDWINQALRYAIRWQGVNGERVNVISMSLGGVKNDEEHQLIREAAACGITVVCAAGNQGDGKAATTERIYPGAYPEVIEVGAVNFDKKIADFSNTNRQIDFVAPGVNIISTYPGGKYAKMSGTSMAAPHVTGAIALICKTIHRPTARQIYDILRRHAVNLGHSPKAQGNGLIDLKGLSNNRKLLQPDVLAQI